VIYARQGFVKGLIGLLFVVCGSFSRAAENDPPTDWVDPATGHRVVRLSREADSKNLYFHQNAYSTDGSKVVITSPSGISTVDLRTHEIDEVIAGRVRPLVTGRKTGDLYHLRGDDVWAANLDTHEVREVVTIPTKYQRSNITVNSHETMIVGLAVDPSRRKTPIPIASWGVGRQDCRW
jgi:oligogalacturonide lyase